MASVATASAMPIATTSASTVSTVTSPGPAPSAKHPANTPSLKRRPPSLVIDPAVNAVATAAATASAASSSAASNLHTSSQSSPVSGSSAAAPLTARPGAKSAREIMQGLALHCVSPGLPPMSNATIENIRRCKEIERQQRILIAMRQRSSDPRATGSDDNEEEEDSKDGILPHAHTDNSDISSSSSSGSTQPQITSVRKTAGPRPRARRAPPPIRIVDPAQYSACGYERAIQSAPLARHFPVQMQSHHHGGHHRHRPRMPSASAIRPSDAIDPYTSLTRVMRNINTKLFPTVNCVTHYSLLAFFLSILLRASSRYLIYGTISFVSHRLGTPPPPSKDVVRTALSHLHVLVTSAYNARPHWSCGDPTV
ncbi:uncharacterized protein V1518DRAFT_416444 [Limtongia smithiae]|uniref:uncharacterized protein n=1 Tax=Limtongia smithiae TaxID=1125753 RepID=UPI0034CD1E16